MSSYFSKFPIMQYQNVFVRDITRRTNFMEDNLSNPKSFLPYTVHEGERPEDIANLYYGSVDATWLVLLANNITDPYYDWPMDENQFNKYMINKYTQESNKKDFAVLDWTRNNTINDNIVYYYREVNSETPEMPSSLVPEAVVQYFKNKLPDDFESQVIVINGIEYLIEVET